MKAALEPNSHLTKQVRCWKQIAQPQLLSSSKPAHCRRDLFPASTLLPSRTRGARGWQPGPPSRRPRSVRIAPAGAFPACRTPFRSPNFPEAPKAGSDPIPVGEQSGWSSRRPGGAGAQRPFYEHILRGIPRGQTTSASGTAAGLTPCSAAPNFAGWGCSSGRGRRRGARLPRLPQPPADAFLLLFPQPPGRRPFPGRWSADCGRIVLSHVAASLGPRSV